jgi:hypothetical protein
MQRAEPLRSERLYAVSGRFFLISIGLFSVCWSIITFPVSWSDARLDYTADRILDGEQFKREILQNLLADAGSAERTWPRPEALRSAAVIRLRLAEQANKAEGARPLGAIFDQLGVAASIQRSLSAAPADPFLWLALFRSKRMKDDRSKEDFSYLRMSYLVGPHEGWVAVKRNHIALAIFPELPQDVAQMAVTEFKDLVASAYYDAAIQILVGPGWPIRDMLLRRLEHAPIEARRQFAQSADQLGYDDIVVPGVERPSPRPWR